MNDDLRAEAVKFGLRPNVSLEMEQNIERLGGDILYDVCWQPTPAHVLLFNGPFVEEPLEDGDEILESVPPEDFGEIDIDEFFPRRLWVIEEKNKPYEVDEHLLFNPRDSYEDKLE